MIRIDFEFSFFFTWPILLGAGGGGGGGGDGGVFEVVEACLLKKKSLAFLVLLALELFLALGVL